MMETSVKVSVVIPTYNRAELLRLALESVMSQTLRATEVVVVDDGSTDHTREVVADVESKGRPIIYLSGPHGNKLGELRNRGVEATTGEWIAFLDSDDLWLPQRLARQVEALRERPRVGMAFCNVQPLTEDGLPGSEPYLPAEADYNGYILGDLLEEPVAVPSALMVRREAFEQVGGFPDRPINEDYELTLLIAARYAASYVPEALVLMRRQAGSRSHVQDEAALTEYVCIVKDFLRARTNLPMEVRVKGRRGLANVHFKLANRYLAGGEKALARRHLFELMKLRPWDRRTPKALWQTVIPSAARVT